LAAGGEAGVRAVIDELAEELRLAMILLGSASIDEIGPALVRRGSAGHGAFPGE
jgi:isopentenyl diphosphate isomerase/L-lactate dehydrogenase-like FMN-dependent dehydrogenase